MQNFVTIITGFNLVMIGK